MDYSYANPELQEGKRLEKFGLKFTWTTQHSSPKDHEPLIHSYDTTCQEAVEEMDKISPTPYAFPPPRDGDFEDTAKPDTEKRPRRDLYELMQEMAPKNEKIGKLWDQINTVPDWVDWAQIERGQKVFFRYGGPCIVTVCPHNSDILNDDKLISVKLTFLSLLGGMGSGRTVETLDRTGSFDAKVVRRRLLETSQHTLNVYKDLPSIQPGGDGFANSVRVRLLHTAVRRRIMAMAAQQPSYYNIAQYGVPINDLDSMGTIMTFCCVPIWMGLPRQGIYLRAQEKLDFLALWRYVAYLMGVPHDWLSTEESAKAMMESLFVSEFKPSKASAVLANNIITGFRDLPPTYASADFMRAETYWLNGTELSEALGIRRPSVYYSALVLGQCMLFCFMGYLYRSFERLDRWNINIVKKTFFRILLHDKSLGALGYTSKFHFKYIPEFSTMSTARGEVEREDYGVLRRGVERSALLSLITFSSMIGASLWFGSKALVAVLGY
ncbi:hypothetical protein F5Y18DRAFT_443716 [Xylariaceae sp. FL1019]|nr:hypothetical protein F5Y18DRAFT_443716 [Xylariaceae sp. FL1019]